MMSVNAPPAMLISNTPPSKKLGGLACRLKLFRNVNCEEADSTGMMGESIRLSLIVAGSFIHAALGNESATGVGTPEFDDCQKMLSGLVGFVASHSAGSAGGVTLLKFSLKSAHGLRRRTVDCSAPKPKVAVQLTACTNPLVGLVKLNCP